MTSEDCTRKCNDICGSKLHSATVNICNFINQSESLCSMAIDNPRIEELVKEVCTYSTDHPHIKQNILNVCNKYPSESCVDDWCPKLFCPVAPPTTP